MIAYIEGRYLEQRENSVILLTASGLGYEVFVSPQILAQLPEKGSMLCLYTVHIIRQDAAELFGFKTWDERELFLVLNSINGVGPRKALTILATFSPDDLRRITAEDDNLALMQVSGIGKKSAQQIFLALQFKMADNINVSIGTNNSKTVSEALAGLTNLGYKEEEARALIKDILQKQPDLDAMSIIRASLQHIANAKQKNDTA